MSRLGIFQKMEMYNFFMANLKYPETLAKEYLKNPEKWEALKKEYPDWKKYTAKYPELCKFLKEFGVSI